MAGRPGFREHIDTSKWESPHFRDRPRDFDEFIPIYERVESDRRTHAHPTAINYFRENNNGIQRTRDVWNGPITKAPRNRHATAHDSLELDTWHILKLDADVAVQALLAQLTLRKPSALHMADRIVIALSRILRERLYRNHQPKDDVTAWDLQAQIRMVVARPFGMIHFYRLVCDLLSKSTDPINRHSFDAYIAGSYRAISNMYTVVDGRPKFLATRYGPCINMEVVLERTCSGNPGDFVQNLQTVAEHRKAFRAAYDRCMKRAYLDRHRHEMHDAWMREYHRPMDDPSQLSGRDITCGKLLQQYLGSLGRLWMPFLHVPWCYMAPMNKDHAATFMISADMLESPVARVASVDHSENIDTPRLLSVRLPGARNDDEKHTPGTEQDYLDKVARNALTACAGRRETPDKDIPHVIGSRADSIVAMLARVLRAEMYRDPFGSATHDLQMQIFLVTTRPYIMTRVYSTMMHSLHHYNHFGGDKQKGVLHYVDDSMIGIMSIRIGFDVDRGYICVPMRGCVIMNTTLMGRCRLGSAPIGTRYPDDLTIFINAMVMFMTAKGAYLRAKHSGSPVAGALEEKALKQLALTWVDLLKLSARHALCSRIPLYTHYTD